MDRKLIRPETMEQALTEREKYGRDALPIAGGQSLLVLLRNKLIDPKMLIDLQVLSELEGIQQRDGGLSIGAMTTIHDLSSSTDIQKWALVFRSRRIEGRLDGDSQSRHDRRQPLSQ